MTLNEVHYPGYENIGDIDLQRLKELEYAGIERTNFLCLTSDWAIENTKKYFPNFSDKYVNLPLSSQVYPPPCPEERNELSINRENPVNFLFIGRDWSRKGGDKAVEIIRKLNERGIKAKLTIVGEPQTEIEDLEFVEVLRISIFHLQKKDRPIIN